MTNTLTGTTTMSLTDTCDVCTSCTLMIVNSLGEGRLLHTGHMGRPALFKRPGRKKRSNFVKVCQSWLGFNAFGLFYEPLNFKVHTNLTFL